MLYRIAIIRSGKAFVPEADAYAEALMRAGHEVHLVSTSGLSELNVAPDLIIRFGGLLNGRLRSGVPEVHNYASASLGPFPRLKNVLKSFAACRAAGYIYLNPFVRRQFFFSRRIPFIYRDMGAFKEFYAARDNATRQEKDFDVVYAGSITGRTGLVGQLLKLKALGAKVGVAGSASDADAEVLRKAGVDYLGRLPLGKVPRFVASGRFGLNFCPDRYPFRYQTSTKAIEFLVAGIPILSNRYSWIEKHSKELGYDYIDIDNVTATSDLVAPRRAVLPPDIAENLLWDKVLESCGFQEFISNIINDSSRN